MAENLSVAECLRALVGIYGSRLALCEKIDAKPHQLTNWITSNRVPVNYIRPLVAAAKGRFSAEDFLPQEPK